MMTTSNQAILNPVQDEPRGATVAQLRADIDKSTGDKVVVTDHPVAPLGTDEEAAGTPIASHVIARTRHYERNKNTATRKITAVEIRLYWFLAVLTAAGLVMAAMATNIRVD